MLVELQGTTLALNVIRNFGSKYRNFTTQKVAQPNPGYKHIYRKPLHYAQGKTLRNFFRFFLLFQVPHSLNVCSHARARVREQKIRIKTNHIEHLEQCGTCKLRTCMKVSKSFALSVIILTNFFFFYKQLRNLYIKHFLH